MSSYYKKLSNKCIKIIEDIDDVDKAINKISKLKHDDDTPIGKKMAVQIYIKYAHHAVNYDKNTYQLNIDKYLDKINSKKEKAFNSKSNK